jgi:16S rRNA (guanine527-N7)-methyltransferase
MNLLYEGAKSLGIQLSDRQLDQFDLYYHELADWNQRANLTSITGNEETQVKHFLDSLTACLPFSQGPGASAGNLGDIQRVVDIGSGAGFPGLALKLAFPAIQLHLVESVGKKTAFLEHMVGMLELENVTVHNGRAEALGRLPELREAFDLALVRGVARTSLLLEYSLPFCRLGGHAVALKHGGLDAELSEAEYALSELGGTTAGVFPVTLNGLTDDRVVATFEKTSPTPDRYPRRVGIPAKRPL